MKNIYLLFCMILLLNICYSQNLRDAYATPAQSISRWAEEINDYSGEYSIFLDKFYWERDEELESETVTYSIEIVSFPFIPVDFKPTAINDFSSYTQRTLSSDFITEDNDLQYGNIHAINSGEDYYGYGWEYGGYNIYQKLYNTLECGPSDSHKCIGDFGLISYSFYDGIGPNNDDQGLLPHTIIKHTLYFHCGDSFTSPIMDSISWVYDNTRGAMNEYPFYNPSTDDEEIGVSAYDVTFRPSFFDLEGANYPYLNQNSNSLHYNSGIIVSLLPSRS